MLPKLLVFPFRFVNTLVQKLANLICQMIGERYRDKMMGLTVNSVAALKLPTLTS